jgi:threonine dehydratase
MIEEVVAASLRVKKQIYRTPLIHSGYLSQFIEGQVFLKMESEQITGSFKARGAANKLIWLKEKYKNPKIITASTGNHGLGVAFAMKKLGLQGKIVLPQNASSAKVEAIQRLGAEIVFHGSDCFESEIFALQFAKDQDFFYVSPYNDPQVIGGQGTIGLEILEQTHGVPPDDILVTIGGGGLISGIATAIKSIYPNTQILGCQPELSPEMTLSIQNNRYTTVESRDTLSDASAGAFEENSITYGLCKKWVDDFYLISENQIAEAIRTIYAKERKTIEGAAGVAVAPLLNHPEKFRNRNVVVVVCGGNISGDKLSSVLRGEL